VSQTDLPTLAGVNVLLRRARSQDQAARLAVGYNREYVRLVGGELPPVDPTYTAADAAAWYEGVLREPYGWVIEVAGRCVGTARLHSLRPAERRARYAIGLFDAAAWNRGIGLETTRLVLAYAFDTLRLHRVDLRVLAFNTRAIAMYRRAGFVVEGTERDGAWINGRWESDVWMSILEEEYHAHD
jgi:ribosomal-protein-alanine N-acetyltransferase